MGKTKLVVHLAAAYAAGLVLLVGLVLALPCPRVRMALAHFPEAGQRAVQLVRVAAHAGSLGVKHLPTLLEPQGATPRQRMLRYCLRERAAACGSTLAPPASLVLPVVRLVLDDG